MMVVNLKSPKVGMERWCKISYVGQASPPLPLLPPPQKKARSLEECGEGCFIWFLLAVYNVVCCKGELGNTIIHILS